MTPLDLLKYGELDIEGEGGAKVGEGVGVVCVSMFETECLGDVTIVVTFLEMMSCSSRACSVEKVYSPGPDGQDLPASIMNLLSDSTEYFLM